MRLIDADNLIEFFTNLEKAGARSMVFAEAKRFVNEQPTAYDVDKVIGQLEEKTDIAYKRYMDCNSATPAVIHSRYETQYHERAECLEIVRAGMKE